jgi:hypothetical protein
MGHASAHVIWTGTGASVRSAISANVAVAKTTSVVGSGPPIEATHWMLRLLSRLVIVSVALNGTPLLVLAWQRVVSSMSLLKLAAPLTASGRRGIAIRAGSLSSGRVLPARKPTGAVPSGSVSAGSDAG